MGPTRRAVASPVLQDIDQPCKLLLLLVQKLLVLSIQLLLLLKEKLLMNSLHLHLLLLQKPLLSLLHLLVMLLQIGGHRRQCLTKPLCRQRTIVLIVCRNRSLSLQVFFLWIDS